MSEQGFNQLNFPQELGTGDASITIHDYGCAECSLTSECVNAGHATNPLQFNQDLIRVEGYADNGEGAKDLIKWDYIAKIYPDMTLVFNNRYPTTPADMSLVDSQLQKGLGVIVGVSFHHNPNQQQPDHFVRIYKKNTDGTYQCFDSWALDGVIDVNFDKRYAVNGMSAANAVLQAVSYNYTPSNATVNGVMYGTPNQYDLTNQDSMKVAVDVLNRLQTGELVDKLTYEQKVEADQKALDAANSNVSKMQTDVQAYEGICALLQLPKDNEGNNANLQEATDAITVLKTTATQRLAALNKTNEKLNQVTEALKNDPAQDYDLGVEILQIEKDRDSAVIGYTSAKKELGLSANAVDKDVIAAIDELKKKAEPQPQQEPAPESVESPKTPVIDEKQVNTLVRLINAVFGRFFN